jgi:hypothetical protein
MPRSGKYLKKLAGNTEVEDSLRRLDNLTQEEARMAAAELLKVADSLGERVQEIGVQGVGSDVKDVTNKIQGIDSKVDQVNRSSFPGLTTIPEASDIFTGNQLRDSLLRWLSPPDPFINHNAASKAHHNGTTRWFFRGRIFKQWRSTGSLLWIHGKRTSLLVPHDNKHNQ